MLKSYLVLSTVRRIAISANPARRYASRDVATIGERRQGRHVNLRVELPSGKIKKLTGPLTRTRTVSLPKVDTDFVFDPFPAKLLTAHPTVHERLERPDLAPTHAQLRNIELGKTLMLKYGSAKLALQALRAAERRNKLRMQVLQQRLQYSWQTTRTRLRQWRIASRLHGYKVSFAQQHIGIREAAVESSRGIEKQNALFLLRGELPWASTLELLLPFRRHVQLQTVLFLLYVIPHRSLQGLGKQGLSLNAELKVMIKDLQYHKQQTSTLSDLERRYNSIKRPAFGAFLGVKGSLVSHWKLHKSLISYTEHAESALSRLHKPLKIFRRGLGSFSQTCINAAQMLSTIMLRRQSLQDTKQQNIFNALHHHIKWTLVQTQYHHRSSLLAMQSILDNAASFGDNHRIRSPPILVHGPSILEALDGLKEGMHQIIKYYYEEFLPFWISGIKLMSPCELARQDRVARRYWLSCLRSDRKHELRFKGLQYLYDSIHSVRHNFENGMEVSECRRRQARIAITRLSQLHVAQNRGNVEHSTRPSCNDVPKDAAMNTSRRSAVLPARKTVLWQPNMWKHQDDAVGAAESLEQQFLSKSPGCTPFARKTVLWQPSTQKHQDDAIETAEKLFPSRSRKGSTGLRKLADRARYLTSHADSTSRRLRNSSSKSGNEKYRGQGTLPKTRHSPHQRQSPRTTISRVGASCP